MDEEVAIVDSANLLFTGNIETGSSSFSRFKTPLKIKVSKIFLVTFFVNFAKIRCFSQFVTLTAQDF